VVKCPRREDMDVTSDVNKRKAFVMNSRQTKKQPTLRVSTLKQVGLSLTEKYVKYKPTSTIKILYEV
jgi:hypothetical protein